MSPNHPLTEAWTDVRETIESTAEQYRQDGYTVIEAVSNHGTVRHPDGAPVTFVFTVMDSVADEVAEAIDDGTEFETEVRYVDVDAVRLFVLDVHGDDLLIMIAGGIQHDVLLPHASDAEEPGRVAVRRADGTRAAQFTFERISPFITDLEETSS